jgi:hypothetical protein
VLEDCTLFMCDYMNEFRLQAKTRFHFAMGVRVGKNTFRKRNPCLQPCILSCARNTESESSEILPGTGSGIEIRVTTVVRTVAGAGVYRRNTGHRVYGRCIVYGHGQCIISGGDAVLVPHLARSRRDVE